MKKNNNQLLMTLLKGRTFIVLIILVIFFSFGQFRNVCGWIVSVAEGKNTSSRFGKLTMEYSPVPLYSSVRGTCKYVASPERTSASSGGTG